MSGILCLMPEEPQEIECICFDQRTCDVHISEGGHLICRHGSNEGVVNGIVKVICPLEIAIEQKKWDAFLKKEINEK